MKAFLNYVDRNKVFVCFIGMMAIATVIGLGLRSYLPTITYGNRVVPVSLVVEVSEKVMKEKQMLLELKQRKFELCIYEHRTTEIAISDAEKCKVHLN